MAILGVFRSGHWPSLAGAWLHLTVSFMVWLLIGAMSISLARDLQLSDQQVAWLVALPLLGGAGLRMLAGWSADWVGAWPTALVILLAELAALLWGWLGVSGYHEALIFALASWRCRCKFCGILADCRANLSAGCAGVRVGSDCVSERRDCADPLSCAAMAGCDGLAPRLRCDGLRRRCHTGAVHPSRAAKSSRMWRPVARSGGAMRRNSSAAGLPIGSVSYMPSHSAGLSGSAACCRCCCTISISWMRSWLAPSPRYVGYSVA